MLQDRGDELAPAVPACSVEHRFQVVLDGVGGQVQPGCDLAGRHADRRHTSAPASVLGQNSITEDDGSAARGLAPASVLGQNSITEDDGSAARVDCDALPPALTCAEQWFASRTRLRETNTPDRLPSDSSRMAADRCSLDTCAMAPASFLGSTGSRKAMAGFGVPEALAGPFGLGLPLVELADAALLLPVATAWWAALGALALLATFVAAIAVNMARGKAPDCHCFGPLHSAPVGWKTLARNGVFAAVAVPIAVWGRPDPGPSVIGWLGPLSAGERAGVITGLVAGVLVVLAMVIQGWLLVQLMRQNGRLLLPHGGPGSGGRGWSGRGHGAGGGECARAGPPGRHTCSWVHPERALRRNADPRSLACSRHFSRAGLRRSGLWAVQRAHALRSVSGSGAPTVLGSW